MSRVCEPLNPPEAHVLQPWVAHDGPSLVVVWLARREGRDMIAPIEIYLQRKKIKGAYKTWQLENRQ